MSAQREVDKAGKNLMREAEQTQRKEKRENE